VFRYPDDMPDYAGPRDHTAWPKPTGAEGTLFL
jgi:hypothetical protein